MTYRRPRILISNDDGFFAKGLKELYTALRELGDITVVAPDTHCSGASRAITSDIPIRYERIHDEPGLTIYSCSGTPADCVKLALNEILPELPDLVVGGINQGGNEGIAVNYSGTVGLVAEGAIFGIPSMAVSLLHGTTESDYLEACRVARKVARHVLSEGLPSDTFLNINVPNIPELKGIRVATQARGRFRTEYVKQQRPKGDDVFWLSGAIVLEEPIDPMWDVPLLDEGYATIVPCQIDATAYDAVEKLAVLNE